MNRQPPRDYALPWSIRLCCADRDNQCNTATIVDRDGHDILADVVDRDIAELFAAAPAIAARVAAMEAACRVALRYLEDQNNTAAWDRRPLHTWNFATDTLRAALAQPAPEVSYDVS